ncbi:Matrix metalloproteinase-14 [Holothuria leucospilota]|uniref:Matrix metalloproteinase-14 n=1 Tax=Holothuria leucospilota TaxID=206669 RepID=A0A9Q0YGU9_HOLLE|nr:Matrix metalloproteinase-14 [Holothuria leucospilota]
MTLKLLGRVCLIVVLMAVYGLSAPVPDNRNIAIEYLTLYKYLNILEGEVSSTDFKLALQKFQQNNELDVTGQLNSATLTKMRNPTCRDTDLRFPSVGLRVRERRYSVAQGVKWTKTDITYNVLNAPTGLSKLQVLAEFQRAFNAWQSVCGLTFRYWDAPNADIIITFFSGYHGDYQVFDGPGGNLAHAYIPIDNGQGIYGDIHMDIDEQWVLRNGGINLYQVALHEIGHTLGLGHSGPNTVMHALFSPVYDSNFRLQADDIMGAQFLYGPNAGTGTVPEIMPTPGDNMPDDTCVHSVDAIATLPGDSVLTFMGQEVFKLSTKGSIEDGYPKLLTDVFGNIMSSVSKIDAAVLWPPNLLYLFVGSQYYRYTLTSLETSQPWPLDQGYPKPIVGNWYGIPNDIDSATILPNRQVYFFKGNQYFKFGYHENSYQVLPGYPRLIASHSRWAALLEAGDILASTLWSDGNIYLFTADNFYAMHGQYEFLFPGYPRSFKAEWFGCDIME